MMDEEQLLGRINQGGKASVILNELNPYLEKMEKEIIYRMKSDFIARKHTPTSLEAYVAELCCCDNLRVRLKQSIAGGISAEKKLEEERNERE